MTGKGSCPESVSDRHTLARAREIESTWIPSWNGSLREMGGSFPSRTLDGEGDCEQAVDLFYFIISYQYD